MTARILGVMTNEPTDDGEEAVVARRETTAIDGRLPEDLLRRFSAELAEGPGPVAAEGAPVQDVGAAADQDAGRD